MFKLGAQRLFPGVAVEMEWNNKDPFFDRDLSNYYALHRAGALAVGVIVTRGPAYNKDYKNATDKDLELRQHIGVSLCPASILAAAANAHFSW